MGEGIDDIAPMIGYNDYLTDLAPLKSWAPTKYPCNLFFCLNNRTSPLTLPSVNHFRNSVLGPWLLKR